jgi:uncharacterized surface anchored protein
LLKHRHRRVIHCSDPQTFTIGYDALAAKFTGNNAIIDQNTVFTLQKQDLNGQALTGTTFELTGVFADSTSSQTKTLLSGASSQTITNGLLIGNTYTLKETAAPNDYLLMTDTISFTMNNDGTLTLAAGTASAVSLTEDHKGIIVKNTPLTAGFELTKYDGTSQAVLAGIKFNLTYTPAGGSAGTPQQLVSDTAGKIAVTALQRGSYVLTEANDDANYQASSFEADFTVDNTCQNKTLVINTSTVGLAPFHLSVKNAGLLNGSGLQNARTLGTVNIQKNDETGKGLNGAYFEVRRKTDDSIVKAAQATANGGTLSFTDLPWDTYYLVETQAPAGYEVSAVHHEFTIGYNSLTRNFTGNDAIANERTDFTLVKQDEAGNALTGSTFALTGIFANDTTVTTKNLLNGTLATESIATNGLVGGNAYTLRETTAPDGYLTLEDSVSFTCNNDGTLVLAAGTSALVSLTANQKGIVVKDEKTKTELIKTDRTTGKTIDAARGTKYRITGNFTDGTTSKEGSDVELSSACQGELKTTKNSDVASVVQAYNNGTVTGLGNVYTLQEITAPAGYLLESTPIHFLINEQGTVTVLGNNMSQVAEAEDTVLRLSDAEVVSSFRKTDADGKTLAGAVFEIAGTFADGSTTKTFTSDTAAYEADALLVSGNTYTLKETSAPDGYLRWHDILSFHVKADGTLTLDSGTSKDVSLSTDQKEIIITDHAASVELIKTDRKTGDPIAAALGTKYQLSGTFLDGTKEKEGSDTALSASCTEQILTTKDKLIPQIVQEYADGRPSGIGHVYELKELTAPAGYTLETKIIPFVVNEENEITVLGNDMDTLSKANGKTLYVSDTETKISFQKEDQKGQALAGAVFQIKGSFADGTSVKTFTSDTKAFRIQSVLPCGQYVFPQ